MKYLQPITALSIALVMALVPTFYAHSQASDIVNGLGTNLEGCWELDEASGARADSSVNGNDLSDLNTVGQGAAIVAGNSASFDDANNEGLFIEDADQTGLDISGDWAFSTWINPDALPSSNGDSYDLMSKGGAGGQYAVVFNDFDDDLQAFADSTNVQTRTDSSYLVSGDVGSKVHVVVVFDISNNDFTVYKNNSAVAESDSGSTSSISDGAEEFILGIDDNDAPDSDDAYDGLMDVAAIWSRTLSSSEVSDLYNNGSGIPCSAGAAAPTPQQSEYFF